MGGGPGLTLEGLLRRDRRITVAGLAALSALAWIYLASGAGMGISLADLTRLSLFARPTGGIPGDMAMPGMLMGAGAPPAAWTPSLWLLTVAMWWTMMVAMMTPTAAPTVLLYARVHRHAQAQAPQEGLAPTWAFAGGYLTAWLAFSLAAAALHWGLERSGLISPATLGSQSRWLSAGVLAAAGLYQLSPLQNLCLSHCRSPAAFLSRHWRPGVTGAVRLGALHGVYCVGCCWVLMLLLFVGGVMNLAWIAVLTLLVMAEKLAPGGRWIGRVAGFAMLALAAATLAR